MIDVQVDVRNAEALRNKLEDQSAMVGEPLQMILSQGTMVIEREVKRITPVDTGRLRASWTSKVDAAAIPKWGKMGTNVVYAAPLEYSRNKRPRGVGQIPFFRPGIAASRPKVDELLKQAQDMIKQHWEK